MPCLFESPSMFTQSLVLVKDRNFTAIVTFFLRDSVISASIVIPMALRCHSCSPLVICPVLAKIPERSFRNFLLHSQIMHERHEARVIRI